MKKTLLLAAAAVMTATAAFAETTYTAGLGIKAASELKEGLYFMHAKFNGDRNKEGFIFGTNQATYFPQFAGSYLNAIPSEGANNINYVWRIVKANDGETNEGFKIQCLGQNGWCFSKMGNGAEAKGNLWRTESLDDANTAIYKLESPVAEYDLSDADHTRFWLRVTNGTFEGKGVNPCLNCNGGDGVQNVAYWDYEPAPNKASNYSNYIQIEFIPATLHAEDPVDITINFPSFNGQDMSNQTLSGYVDDDVTATITNFVNGYGGMSNMTITGQTGSTVISEGNTVFTVEGKWNRELIADHVYRLLLKPTDNPSAMRYDPVTGKILTAYDHRFNSFSYLAPERLWFFQEVKGKTGVYTLHNLADPEKGVYIEDGEHCAATLSDADHPATEFTVGASTWSGRQPGDFYLNYGEGNYLNDRGLPGTSDNKGYLCCWKSGNAKGGEGSAFRLFPLTDSDLETLGVEAGTEPSYYNLSDAITAFNDVNINAALRRIRYYFDGAIGNAVGQYNNAENTAEKMYEDAVAISNGTMEADDDTKKAIVAALDIANLHKIELVYGRYYRLKNKVSNLYVSSISSFTDTNGRSFMDLTEDGTRSNTVFYLDKQGDNLTIVSFDEGLVMSKFSKNKEDNWTLVPQGDPLAATYTTITDKENGYFLIHASDSEDNHRHMYGGSDTANGKVVDAGDLQTDGYQWRFELVTELPATLYNVDTNEPNGWTSIHSPVELEVKDGNATVYTGKFNGTKVEKTKLGDGKTIPANTTVLLHYAGDGTSTETALPDIRSEVSYIYLTVKYTDEQAEVEEENLYDSLYDGDSSATDATLRDLDGGIYAQVKKNDEYKYFTLHASSTNNFREHDTSVDYVPGFKAHIALAHAEVPEEPVFEIVDPDSSKISEIAADGVKNGKVYDLQGRRLAAPAKGINIINGAKVLVK